MKTYRKSMRRKGFGILAPVMTVLVAGAALAAVAGQALGPVLAGAGGGSVGVVASQSLFFGYVGATPGFIGDDGVSQAVASADPSGVIQAAFRMHSGDSPSMLNIEVENRSDGTRSASVRVTHPAGLEVNLEATTFSSPTTCGMAQGSIIVSEDSIVDEYLLVVPGGTTCFIEGSVRLGSGELGTHYLSIIMEELPIAP